MKRAYVYFFGAAAVVLLAAMPRLLGWRRLPGAMTSQGLFSFDQATARGGELFTGAIWIGDIDGDFQPDLAAQYRGRSGVFGYRGNFHLHNADRSGFVRILSGRDGTILRSLWSDAKRSDGIDRPIGVDPVSKELAVLRYSGKYNREIFDGSNAAQVEWDALGAFPTLIRDPNDGRVYTIVEKDGVVTFQSNGEDSWSFEYDSPWSIAGDLAWVASTDQADGSLLQVSIHEHRPGTWLRVLLVDWNSKVVVDEREVPIDTEWKDDFPASSYYGVGSGPASEKKSLSIRAKLDDRTWPLYNSVDFGGAAVIPEGRWLVVEDGQQLSWLDYERGEVVWSQPFDRGREFEAIANSKWSLLDDYDLDGHREIAFQSEATSLAWLGHTSSRPELVYAVLDGATGQLFKMP